MATSPERHPLVLVVSGSGAVTQDLRRLLEPSGVRVQASAEGAVADDLPSVVVVDGDRIRSLPPALSSAPVLAIVRRDAPDEAAAAVAAGAADVLPLPLRAPEVQARVAGAARLAAAEGGLRSRNAELAAWAQRAGHDLMTPLAVISGMAETLEAAWDRLTVADRGRLLASIRNQASRATTMLDEAFALARGEPAKAAGEEPPTAG